MPLDDYDVIREIRRGEHAVVRLARETATGRLVVLRTFDTGDSEALERFRRALETITALDHPGIATVLEVFEDGDSATVVTEWVEAGSLRGVIGELSAEQVAGVVEELLDAVGVAADAGVAHLGLKPENVLITTDGHTKISDFGIASVAWHDTALTRTGGSLRDLSYISPEQVRGEGAGPSTDLYAIGCMTYEMLTGRPPFRSDSKLGLAMAHLESPLPDLRETDPWVPAPMARWVTRMTEKDPADRFADAAAAREALERAVEEAAQAPVPTAPAEAVVEPPGDAGALLVGLRQGARAGVGVRHVSGREPVAEVVQPPVPAPAPPPPQPAPTMPAPPPPPQPAPSLPAPPPAMEPAPPPEPEPESALPPPAAPPPPTVQVGDDRPPARAPMPSRAPFAIARLLRGLRERRVVGLAKLAALAAAAVAAGKLLGLFTIDVELDRELDTVDCTVFAPPEAVTGEPILVQVFVHLPVQEADARALATEFDETATRRAVQGLETEVARGSKLDFQLRVPGADVDEPVASLVWRGRPAAAQFGVTVPTGTEAGRLIATVSVAQDSIPIGHVKFTLAVVSAAAADTPAPVPVGDGASRYRSAFLSYASADRAAVIRGAQMLRSVGITFFQDVVDLDPGERWEQRLYAEIERNDLFLLFWSRAAHDSEWVRREARFALDCATGDFDRPEIKPIILERPPSAPWPELAHLHFNDALAYFVDAGGRS